MSSLEAGQKAGGDKRGQQSANLVVLKKNAGYGGGSDRYIDVRVDDHPNATSELRRVFELYSLTLLQRENPEDISQLTNELLHKIGDKLFNIGFTEQRLRSPEEIQPAFVQWLHTENFENKVRDDGFVWNSILNYLFSK